MSAWDIDVKHVFKVNIRIPDPKPFENFSKTKPPPEFYSRAFETYIDIPLDVTQHQYYGIGQVAAVPNSNKFDFEDLVIDYKIKAIEARDVKFHSRGTLDDYSPMSKKECFAWAEEMGITDLRGDKFDNEEAGGCITNEEKTMMHYNPEERSCVTDIFIEKSDNHLFNVNQKECEAFAKDADYKYVGAGYFDDRKQGCVRKDDEVYFNKKRHSVNKTEAQLNSFAEFTGVQKKITYEQNNCGGSVGGNYDCRLRPSVITSIGAIFSSVDKAKEFCDENNNCVAIAQSENEFWAVRSTDDFLPCNIGDSCDPQFNYLKREDVKREVLCMEKDTTWTGNSCLRTRHDFMRIPYNIYPYPYFTNVPYDDNRSSKVAKTMYSYTAEECEKKAEEMKKDGFDIEFTSPLTTFSSDDLPYGCQTLYEGGRKTVQFNETLTSKSCNINLCGAGDEPYLKNTQCCKGTLGSYTEAECKKHAEEDRSDLTWYGSGNWNDRPYGCIEKTSGSDAYFNKTQTDISCEGALDWEGYSCIKKCSHGGYSCPAGAYSCRPHDDQTFCIVPEGLRRTFCFDGKLCVDWLRKESQKKNNACSFLGHVDEEKIASSTRHDNDSTMMYECCSRNLVGTCKTYRMGGGECFPDHDTTVDYILKNKPDMTLNTNLMAWRDTVSSTMFQCAIPTYTETASGKSDESILSTECRRVEKQFNNLEWSGDSNLVSDNYPYGCSQTGGKVYYNKKKDSPKNCSSSHKCFKRKEACTNILMDEFLKTTYYDIVKNTILSTSALESQDNQYCINSINMFGNDDPDISCKKICCPQQVKSGTPNLSVSKSDCKDYAENIGYTWGGNSNDGNVKGCFAQHGSKTLYYNEKNTSTKCQDVSVSTCIETVDSRVKSWWPEKAVSMKTITKKDACDPELLCCKDIFGNADKQNCPVGIQSDYYNEPTLCPFGHDECKGEVVEESTACCKDIFGNMDRNNCPSSCTCERKCTRGIFGGETCEYKCSDGSCPYGCRNK